MAGSQPRLYVYPPDATGWRDVEVTLYYRRNEDAATPFAGIVVGTRSGADGHTVETPCDAHTYYARLRNDGTADFAKELRHPDAAARGRVTAAALWPDAPATLPSGSRGVRARAARDGPSRSDGASS